MKRLLLLGLLSLAAWAQRLDPDAERVARDWLKAMDAGNLAAAHALEYPGKHLSGFRPGPHRKVDDRTGPLFVRFIYDDGELLVVKSPGQPWRVSSYSSSRKG